LAILLTEAAGPISRRDYAALRTLSGVAPVTKRSGKSCIVTMRYAAQVRLRQAVFRYNNSWAYVDQVLAIAERYSTASLQHGAVGDYALPVDRDRLNIELIRRPHHTYPAWDLALPVGTQVYAVHGGTVIATPAANSRCGLGVVVAGHDGARYTYCHASALQVLPGHEVQPGQPIMRSGNTGRSTGPHLHLDIRWQGQLVCPQPLLQAIAWAAYLVNTVLYYLAAAGYARTVLRRGDVPAG
jgi:murein DD-endopeptidase MepM/ murein hydrolase activator NlpD